MAPRNTAHSFSAVELWDAAVEDDDSQANQQKNGNGRRGQPIVSCSGVDQLKVDDGGSWRRA